MTPGIYRDHSRAGLLDDISQIPRQRLQRIVGFGYFSIGASSIFKLGGTMNSIYTKHKHFSFRMVSAKWVGISKIRDLHFFGAVDP